MLNEIFICSQAVAEELEPDETWGLVSIRSPGKVVGLKEGWGFVLPMEFNDITTKFANFKCFDTDLAHELIAWLENIVAQGKIGSLVIHCEQGVSRSQAVGLFAHKYYAPHLEVPAGPQGTARYNKLVYNTLSQVREGLEKAGAQSGANVEKNRRLAKAQKIQTGHADAQMAHRVLKEAGNGR